MAILAPYVKKGAQELVGAAAEATYQKAKQLLTTLKQKWSGDSKATRVVEDFEQKPAVYLTVLEDTLKTKLVEDQDFAAELQRLVGQMGPTIDATVVAKGGDKAIAVRGGGAVTGGHITATVDATNVKESVGVDITGNIGPTSKD